MPMMARIIVDSVIIDNLLVVVFVDHLFTSLACACIPGEMIDAFNMPTWTHYGLAIATRSCVTSDWFGVHQYLDPPFGL